MKKYIALVDCDTFYASCERVFQPKLRNKPVIVLSNNDGCAIAMSQEVKNLGIKMGEPFFKLKDIIKKHDIAVFSSNYELYGDISARIMNLFHDFSSNVEVYSIDEAFLELQAEDETDWVQIGLIAGIAAAAVIAIVVVYTVKIKGEEG